MLTQKVRLAVQVFGILLAIFLLVQGVWNFNILYIISSLVAALVAGRVFCGWVCPLGFVMERIIKAKNRKLPEFMKGSWFRYGFATLFIIVFVYVTYSGIVDRSIVPLIMMGSMFVLATTVGLIFYNKAWCGYVCPWGVIASLISKVAPNRLAISGDSCKKCYKCTKSCPVGGILEEAISEAANNGKGNAEIPSNCIRCLQCTDACPSGAIDFHGRETAISEKGGREIEGKV